MCTRFFIDVSSEEAQEIMEQAESSALLTRFRMKGPAMPAFSGEVFPTNIIAAIAPDPKKRPRVYPMRFGFTLDRDNRPLVNARSETAGEKPMFRDAFRSRRCIIPASWYFEWEHKKDNTGKVSVGQKYLIQPRGSAMTWLCGLYRIEEGLPVFTVLTREPGEEIRFIHDRMPLILPERYIDDWIRPDTKPEELLGEALTDMAFEKTVQQ